MIQVVNYKGLKELLMAYKNPENAEKFEDLNIQTLTNIAESYGVELKDPRNRVVVIQDLDEEGVTFEMFRSTLETEKEEAEEKRETDLSRVSTGEESVIVRMTRENRSYQFRGKTFTQTHPIVLMNEVDADYLFENLEGFRPATPKETREFYS